MSGFFDGIKELTVGQQAALRRSAGKSLRDVGAMELQAFFTAIPQQKFDAEKAFTVSCIACLWKPEERVSAEPFAKCLRKLRASLGDSGNGVDSRFRNIIDTPWNDEDGFLAAKLVRLVKMLKQSGKGYPDPETLFADLKNWNHPDRFVQRRWMEEYLAAEETDKNNN